MSLPSEISTIALRSGSGPRSPERPRHRLLLVLGGRARQIEVHLVLAGLLPISWKEPDPEPGIIARQQRDAVLGAAGHLPAQDTGPEARETHRVVRVEAEREKVTRHSAAPPIC